MLKTLCIVVVSVTALAGQTACVVAPADQSRPRVVRDQDRDGIPNRYDRDRDGDGVPNRYDRDRDGDGVPNRYDRRPNNPNR